MNYISTRKSAARMTAGRAIIAGPAEDGGLYVPESFPKIKKTLEELAALDYKKLAYEIMSPYLSDFTPDELKSCIKKAYTGRFLDPLVAPLKEAAGAFFLELYHGRTLAFKDMALSVMPHLLKTSCEKYGGAKKIVILTATSGDTGKAALEAFADVKGVTVAVFYPQNGVSFMQKRQMETQAGGNVYVFGTAGNFDDAQAGVKRIFADEELKRRMAERGVVFSSANSINIGRLLPQVVYYFYAYSQLVRMKKIRCGNEINFSVPTGNFGNILAGYYAKCMGLPVKKLICASNINNILTDFFNTGVYDKERPFHTTISPSMDILVSSNLERLLFHTGADLIKDGAYRYNGNSEALNLFYGVHATEEETRRAIFDVFSRGYTIDPHTAVAYHAYGAYKKETGDATPVVVLATASPYKFPEDVCAAAADPAEPAAHDEAKAFEYIKKLSELSGTEIPAQLAGIESKPVRGSIACSPEQMSSAVEIMCYCIK